MPRQDCYLEARDVMTPDPQVVHLGCSLRCLLDAMQTGQFRRLPVLDDEDRLVGIVTDRDVRLAINSPLVLHDRWQDEALLDQVTVDVCMTPDPITARPETPVQEIARLMRARKIGGVPVVDDEGQLVGIVTETDLLRALEELLEKAKARAGRNP